MVEILDPNSVAAKVLDKFNLKGLSNLQRTQILSEPRNPDDLTVLGGFSLTPVKGSPKMDTSVSSIVR